MRRSVWAHRGARVLTRDQKRLTALQKNGQTHPALFFLFPKHPFALDEKADEEQADIHRKLQQRIEEGRRGLQEGGQQTDGNRSDCRLRDTQCIIL